MHRYSFENIYKILLLDIKYWDTLLWIIIVNEKVIYNIFFPYLQHMNFSHNNKIVKFQYN